VRSGCRHGRRSPGRRRPAWRAWHAQHPDRAHRCVPESVWRIGRDSHRRSGTNNGGLAAEREREFALQQGKHFLEVMRMRRRSAAGRHMHIDQAIAGRGIGSADQDRIGAGRQPRRNAPADRPGAPPSACADGHPPVSLLWVGARR
jgi:hypothetical protein